MTGHYWSKIAHSFILVLVLCSVSAELYGAVLRRPEEVPELITHVDLSKQCNMGLKDGIADDQKGGWTDQGANDMRYLPTGINNFGGIPFHVLDPEKTNDKAAILLYSTAKPYFPKETDWIKINSDFECLYLLHGSAWSRPGTEHAQMILKYEDGREVTVPLRVGYEVNEWHEAKPALNAPLGWLGRNDEQSPIGLHVFMWKNPHQGVWVEAIKFKSTETETVPAIVGVTITAEEFTISEPNRTLRGIDLEKAVVRYRARMPMCSEFSALNKPEITVCRTLPEQIRHLKSMDVHLRFAKVQEGTVEVSIGGHKVSKTLGCEEWATKVTFDDPNVIETIGRTPENFPIKVVCGKGIALGVYRFDVSPQVMWAPQGQDGDKMLFGVTFEAHFQTDDLRLAQWGHLQFDPHPARQKPVLKVIEETVDAVDTVDVASRRMVYLNGVWDLASAGPESIPTEYKAKVRVPGYWFMQEGLTEQDKETPGLWYRTRFLVPASFDKDATISLHFQRVAYKATVYLNGVKLGEYVSDVDTFEFDVTDGVKRDGWNELAVYIEDARNYLVPFEQRLTLDINKMFQKQDDHAYVFNLNPNFCGSTDETGRSTMKVLEDGKPLSQPHSKHVDIKKYGQGRFCHWGRGNYSTLFLSTSDNTDPRTNGRSYELVFYTGTLDQLSLGVNQWYTPYDPSEKTMKYFAGIMSDVTLRAAPRQKIDDVFVMTRVRNKDVTVTYEVSGAAAVGGKIAAAVWKDGKKVLDLDSVAFGDAQDGKLTLQRPWANPRLWDIGDPHLYFLKSELLDKDGKVLDCVYTRFGFREMWTEGTDLILNGRKIYIQGDTPSHYNYYIHIRHRLYEQMLQRFYKYINVNNLRFYNGNANDPIFYETADELGIIATIQPPHLPFPYLYDREKEQMQWDKTGKVEAQYRAISRRTRNHPSAMLHATYNEFWPRVTKDEKEARDWSNQLKFIEKLNTIIAQEDPMCLTMVEGSEGGYQTDGIPWTPVTNMHYQWSDAHTRNWKTEMRNRPLIIGEEALEGVWSHFNTQLKNMKNEGKDWRDHYWQKINGACRMFIRYSTMYAARDITGYCPYLIVQWVTPVDGNRGFEHDFYPLWWPALSGPGAKPMHAEVQDMLLYTNWWDPNYPAIPQNPMSDTAHDYFRPQPLPSFTNFKPEVIIEVYQDGKAVAGVPVVLYPLERQSASPVGSVTDVDGKAWIVAPEGGTYRAVINTECQTYTVVVQPQRVKEYTVIATVKVNLDKPVE